MQLRLTVLFQGTEPIFVDMLSIQRVNWDQPVWYAYGQFIRTFLLPMLANAKLRLAASGEPYTTGRL